MKTRLLVVGVLILSASLMWTTGASAQLTVLNANVPAGFEMLGQIQAATLNPGGNPNAGGTLTMNGITMVIPDNTVVQMPANTLRWAQLFDPAVSAPIYDPGIPAPVQQSLTIAAGTSGLALSDNLNQLVGVSPWLPFNASVQGNIDVQNSTGKGVGAYIVGLITPINQDLGNGGSGFITYIDYARGRLEVGGTLNTPNTGTIVEINDPIGRFGLKHSPDPRWSADTDNPTITSGNGYPMCIPRVAPPGVDPDCPLTNRPLNPKKGALLHDPFLEVGAPLQAFFMPASTAPGTSIPDPWKMVPYVVGDLVSFAGVICKLNPAAPLIPYDPTKPVDLATNLPMNRQTYISANTVTSDKLAAYTAPGNAQFVGPAYLTIFAERIGNGGQDIVVPQNPKLGTDGGTIPIAIEPRRNIFIRGWCTDSSQAVDILAVDIDPVTGAETHRLLGTVLPEPGFVAGKGNKGRFRFEVGRGSFLPATRMFMAQSKHGPWPLPPQGSITGLLSGQFHAPNFIFQIADAPPGYPNAPINFQIIPFLFLGEGGNLSAGPLTPFPPYIP